MSNIFNFISKIFLGGETETTSPATADVHSRNQATVNNIINKTVSVLGVNADLSEMSLEILYDDPLEKLRLESAPFMDLLNTSIANKMGDVFKSIKISARSDISAPASGIGDGLYMILDKVEKPAASTSHARATIRAVPGFGSLVKDEYVIDKEGIYNIGFGEKISTANDSIRENFIAIDSDEHSPQFEKHNRYVSREHAHLKYSPTEGLLFFVEIGGTRIKGKRSTIIRGSQTIDADNIKFAYPLYDGDIIELSKKVRLAVSID